MGSLKGLFKLLKNCVFKIRSQKLKNLKKLNYIKWNQDNVQNTLYLKVALQKPHLTYIDGSRGVWSVRGYLRVWYQVPAKEDMGVSLTVRYSDTLW